MPEIVLPNNWQPRSHQMRLWGALEAGKKRALAVWHRRAGKDDVALHWTAVAAHERIGNYWHMLPQAAQARKAIWEAVNPHTGRRRIDEAFPEVLRETTRDDQMIIRLRCGSTWQLVGSDNFNNLVGASPRGIVGSEWALADPQAWSYLRPILLENDGWMVFITTPRGRNHVYKMFEAYRDDPEWFVERLGVEHTKLFSPERLAQEKRDLIAENEGADGEALYAQEYDCSFDAAIVGAYYGKQMAAAQEDKRVTTVPYDVEHPVCTFWDLGTNDSMCIWFAQFIGREIRLIDYYEKNGEGLEHYAKVLKEKPYLYEEDVWPHDGVVFEMGTSKRRDETWHKLTGRRPRIVERAKDVRPGISAVRNLLNRCWFDRARCERGIDALTQYRREWDEDKKTFKDKPLHDWASNPADAFRTLAMGFKVPQRYAGPKTVQADNAGYNPLAW